MTFLGNYAPLAHILLSNNPGASPPNKLLARLCRARSVDLKGLRPCFIPCQSRVTKDGSRLLSLEGFKGQQPFGIFFFFCPAKLSKRRFWVFLTWCVLSLPVKASPLPGSTLWRGPTQNAVVALTFDDGPKSPFTQHLLACLRDLGVKATFFVVGTSIAKEPDLLKQIADEGHELANHSYSHTNFTRISDARIRAEIQQTQDLIFKYTETRPPWFRPPGGNTDQRVQTLLGEMGLVSVMWTLNSEDYTVLNQKFPIKNELKDLKGRYSANYAQDVVNRVVDKVRPGSIVLMHNGGDATLAALPEIVAILRERGYGFVTMSELMQ